LKPQAPEREKNSAVTRKSGRTTWDLSRSGWYFRRNPNGCSDNGSPYKGGDPAAPSGTATLLRLSPNHRSHLRRLPPYGWHGDFGCCRLSWLDGRCVQGPGTYSPLPADQRLLAIRTSCSRVADCNPN